MFAMSRGHLGAPSTDHKVLRAEGGLTGRCATAKIFTIRSPILANNCQARNQEPDLVNRSNVTK